MEETKWAKSENWKHVDKEKYWQEEESTFLKCKCIHILCIVNPYFKQSGLLVVL